MNLHDLLKEAVAIQECGIRFRYLRTERDFQVEVFQIHPETGKAEPVPEGRFRNSDQCIAMNCAHRRARDLLGIKA